MDTGGLADSDTPRYHAINALPPLAAWRRALNPYRSCPRPADLRITLA